MLPLPNDADEIPAGLYQALERLDADIDYPEVHRARDRLRAAASAWTDEHTPESVTAVQDAYSEFRRIVDHIRGRERAK